MITTLEKLRQNSFWFIDYLRGGEIKNHYNDIKLTIENYYSPRSVDKRGLSLVNLLKHATETTQFYADFKDFKSLSDFPVINKILIREKFNDLQSEKFKKESNHIAQTSGSSGTLLTILQDANKRKRNTADTIYFKNRLALN